MLSLVRLVRMVKTEDVLVLHNRRKTPTKFGVRLRQEWKSSTYSDEGYLFLLWEFPEDGRDPIIHVRTWQPEYVNGQRQKPDEDISTLAGFDL